MKFLENAFHSPLAPWIRDFILQKRALGLKYKSEQVLLQSFDRYIIQNSHGEASLTREFLESWFSRRQHESDETRFTRICLTRRLAEFMIQDGVPVDMPPIPHRRLGGSTFVPYIFTVKEIVRLFSAVDRLRPLTVAPHRHIVMPILFRVLYGCGLRLGEALRLRVQDVDLEQGVLTILEAKFKKDRLVPVSSSLVAIFKRYHTEMGERPPKAIFFPAPHGEVYSQSGPYAVFRSMLRASKIPHGGRGKGPRIHDFRHTFAVHRLESWFRDGEEISNKLPFLATYMGHYSLSGTQRYLQLTRSLIPDLSATLDQRFGNLIPGGAL